MMKPSTNNETIEKAFRHTNTSPTSSVKDTADISLIPFLCSPFDQHDLEKALDGASSGMLLLDTAGLQADTLLYAEERFFSFYEKTIEKAKENLLFLLCPFFTPQKNGLLGASHQAIASRELLFSQLCAALRASANGQIALILPCASTVQEIEATRRLVEQAMRKLTARRLPFDQALPLGILLTTPAAFLLSRKLIEAVDFVMIDTDLLTQSLLNSAPVSEFFERSPSECSWEVLRLAEMAIGNAHLLGRFAMIGGSLALDPRFFPHFLAMGANGLIVPAQKLEKVKRRLQSTYKNITQNSR